MHSYPGRSWRQWCTGYCHHWNRENRQWGGAQIIEMKTFMEKRSLNLTEDNNEKWKARTFYKPDAYMAIVVNVGGPSVRVLYMHPFIVPWVSSIQVVRVYPAGWRPWRPLGWEFSIPSMWAFLQTLQRSSCSSNHPCQGHIQAPQNQIPYGEGPVILLKIHW